MKKRLFETVKEIEGFRDGCYHYDALEERAVYIEEYFRSLGFTVESDRFDFGNRRYRNLIATESGIALGKEWVLVGAHYDAVMGSPGADDNASGVAVMLETARYFGPRRGLKFVAFSLEEPQATGAMFLYGSKHFVKKMQPMGHNYRAVFNLESVGYVSEEPGSQMVPPLMKAPDIGDFIALVGNKKATEIMERFEAAAKRCEPPLKTFSHKALMSGYLLPQTRFSDHAPFWDAGYPAVMLTDTAMMRNPNYHTSSDTSDTISPAFMEQVATALIRTVEGMLDE